MKKATLPLIIAMVVLTGCMSHYVMRLNNNCVITTATKPQLKDGVYYFKDAKGEEQAVAEFRVREIAPARMAAREDKPQPVQMHQRKKHKWYFLWLA